MLELHGLLIGRQQQAVTFRQVGGEQVRVIHHANCFTDSCSAGKTIVGRIRLWNEFVHAPISLPSAPGSQIDATQQVAQLGRVQFDPWRSAGSRGQLKRARLQSLVPNAKPVAIPEQDLDPIALTIQKQEQMARQRVLFERLLGQVHQAIEAVSHARGRCAQEDPEV
jgi:hypothetical protein